MCVNAQLCEQLYVYNKNVEKVYFVCTRHYIFLCGKSKDLQLFFIEGNVEIFCNYKWENVSQTCGNTASCVHDCLIQYSKIWPFAWGYGGKCGVRAPGPTPEYATGPDLLLYLFIITFFIMHNIQNPKNV